MTDVQKQGVFFRTAYNYDTDLASEVSGLHCVEQTLTQQQFKDEADINEIFRRFGLGQGIPQTFQMPTSQDFTEVATDYHQAMNIMARADQEFMSLPAQLRAEFDNDPHQLMTFLEDEANREEAIKLGLLKAPEGEAPPLSVRVVPEKVDGTT